MDEGTKKCYMCGLHKDRQLEFHSNKGRPDGVGTACKECTNIATLRRQRANRDLINTLKSRPCTDCNKKYPPHVMQFDHVRGEKKFNVGEARSRSVKNILVEVAKTEVVCANCHAMRTYNRRVKSGEEQ